MISGKGLAAITDPAALAALGEPAREASRAYEAVLPYSILRHAAGAPPERRDIGQVQRYIREINVNAFKISLYVFLKLAEDPRIVPRIRRPGGDKPQRRIAIPHRQAAVPYTFVGPAQAEIAPGSLENDMSIRIAHLTQSSLVMIRPARTAGTLFRNIVAARGTMSILSRPIENLPSFSLTKAAFCVKWMGFTKIEAVSLQIVQFKDFPAQLYVCRLNI